MTVQAGPTEQRYVANGVTTTFSIPFLLIEPGDLTVLLNGVETTSGFTLVGVGNPTSSIVFNVAPIGDLYLVLDVPFERLFDYQENGDFLANTVNNDFDRIWQALKQLFRYSGRALALGLFDVDGQGWYRANGNGIRDIATPVLDQDAVNKLWAQQYIAGILETGQGPDNNAYNVAYPGFNAGITTIGEYLDERVPFTVANVAELRTAVGRGDGDRAMLLGYFASNPGVGAGHFRRITAATPADNGVTVFGAPGNVRWIREESDGPIDVRWAGAVPTAVYDAGMPDSKDAVALAQAAAGVNGVVHFPLPPGQTEAHYLLNATGINLAGSWISADPGVIIHAPFTSDNEGQKPRLIGDVVFSEQAPVAANTYRTERGQNLNPLIAGISAGMATAATTVANQQRKFSFVSDARAVRISNLDTSAFTLDATGMTIVDNQVSWATPAAAGADLQGVEFAAAAGAEIECIAHNVSNGGASGSFYIGVRAVAVNGGTATARYYKFTIAAGAYQIYSGTTLLQTVIFNNEADRFNDVQGPVRVGIRIGANSRFIQLILNGKNYGELDLGSTMAHSIFYMADLDGRNTIKFKYPIARNRDMLVSPKPLKIACLGDSITRGARSSNEWPQLLRDFGQHMPGIGQITELNNMAVSGISAATIAANIGTYDFTGYDYALVMLGTNDCQSGGNGGLGAFFSNIVIIAQAIAADGAKPIFGVIPTYTSNGVTGNGNATTNSAYIPNYQQVIRERILNAGYNVADVDEFFGNNYGFPGSFDTGLSTSWYNDNIHPNTKGQIAVASAFAAALSRLAVRPVRGCYVSMIKPGGSFAINGEANHGILRAVLQGNTVEIHGAVSGGAAGQVIGALPVWARPAGYVRKAIFARTGGAQVMAGLEIRNDGNLVSGTLAWGTEQADLSVSYHT